MPSKRKKSKPFRAVTAVKAMAREAVGSPPPTRRRPDIKKEAELKRTKHKDTIEKLLREGE